ncbi:MAG TPA: SRPBCC family protein [Candidatus Eisenbacteria bacterium]|nr:SRPBCC family protein [Candidatus Eisenbacteria bacterium]
MKKPLDVIAGLGVGAALMYIFDPLVGRRRRALVRDKMVRLGHKTADAIDVTARDLKNRAVGLAAETKSWVAERGDVEISDEKLRERVRSSLGPVVSHPSSIEVHVEHGKVTLSGPILAQEVDRVIRHVSGISGVKEVENRLEVHEEPGNVPGLQGEAAVRKAGQLPDLMQANWSPATRFIAGTAGGALALYGLRRLTVFGGALAAVGTALVARALTNIEFKRLTGVGAGRRAIDIHKTVNVAAPVEEVFSFWTNYENFPRFMSNVREVRDIGNNRSHWVVAGPAGVPVEWDAELTSYTPNAVVAWKTVPGSPIQHAGIVRFQPNPDGSTRLDIRMTYNPVAGGLGHLVATLFGADPKSEMDADLMRMKSMIETGVPPHDAARRDRSGDYIH